MRSFLPLFFLVTVLPLQAAFFSNALGMDLGPKEALDGSGYEGEIEGSVTTIYKDGEPVLVRAQLSNGYILRESGREERVFTDGHGRRLSRTVTEGGVTERTVYEYDGDRLSAVTSSGDDGIVSRIEYLDSSDGLLAGISGSKTALYGASFYLYEAEDGLVKVSLHGESVKEPEEYVLEEDGSWSGDGTEYSRDGLLQTRSEDGLTEYFLYSSGMVLEEKTVTEGRCKTVYRYDTEGRVQAEELYEDGILVRAYDRSDPGSVTETRYEGGTAMYRLTYDGDGKRIRRVEKLI